MSSPFPTNDDLQRAAYQAALEGVRTIWEGKGSVLNPNTRLSSLSMNETHWIVAMAVSQWIVERSRQATEHRCSYEAMIKTAAGNPEPWETGAVRASLPALAAVVEDMGINEKTIGEWSRDEIVWFAWSCFKLIDSARTNRDETPDPIDFGTATEIENVLGAA